jgi:hypothetical protein
LTYPRDLLLGPIGAARRHAQFRSLRLDGFREPGFSKERRLEPQITVGLLTDATGFPLMIEAFEGNKAETKTMLLTITSFMAAHQLKDVTVVADDGMVSEANREAIEEADLSYIIGARIPEEPYQVKKWRKDHLGQDIPDGHVCTAPWPANAKQRAQGRRDKVTYYRYKADSEASTPKTSSARAHQEVPGAQVECNTVSVFRSAAWSPLIGERPDAFYPADTPATAKPSTTLIWEGPVFERRIGLIFERC